MSSVHVFPACTKFGCFHRGLKENTCPKCKTIYTDTEPSKSAVCEMVVSKENEKKKKKKKKKDEITLFHSQIEELLRGMDKTIVPDEKRTTDQYCRDVTFESHLHHKPEKGQNLKFI